MSCYVKCCNLEMSPRLKDKNIYKDIDETSAKEVSFAVRMEVNKTFVKFANTIDKYISRLKDIGITTDVYAEVDYDYFMYIRSIVVSFNTSNCSMVKESKLKARFDMSKSMYHLAILSALHIKGISRLDISPLLLSYTYSACSIIDALLQECDWVNIVDWLHNKGVSKDE